MKKLHRVITILVSLVLFNSCGIKTNTSQLTNQNTQLKNSQSNFDNKDHSFNPFTKTTLFPKILVAYLENPIEIALGKFKKVEVSDPNNEIQIIKGKTENKFIIIPSYNHEYIKNGIELIYTFYDSIGNKKSYPTKFKLISLPKPRARWNGVKPMYFEDEKDSLKTDLLTGNLELYFDDHLFNNSKIEFTITSFKIKAPKQPTIKIIGNEITEDALKSIEHMKGAGEFLIFDVRGKVSKINNYNYLPIKKNRLMRPMIIEIWEL